MADITFVKGEYGVTQPFDLTANNPSFSDAGTSTFTLKICRKEDVNTVVKTITLVRTANGQYDWSVASGDTDLAPGEYILSIEGTGTSRKFKTATESPDWTTMEIQDDAG
jgi:hypothetical protein